MEKFSMARTLLAAIFCGKFTKENFDFYRWINFRAQKRSAWRHERLKTLEQDAAIAQQMIKTMNETADNFADKNEVSLPVSKIGMSHELLFINPRDAKISRVLESHARSDCYAYDNHTRCSSSTQRCVCRMASRESDEHIQ